MITKRIIICVMFAGILSAFGKQQQPLDFSRYDLILSRRPFGGLNSAADTVGTEPVAQVIDPKDSFVKDYQMCAIRDSLAGVSVGLVNLKAKPALSFFLFEGDEIDGVYLVEADFTEEKALLRKDGDDQWISMSGAIRSLAPARVGRYSDRLDLVSAHTQISNRLRHRSPIKPVKVMTVDEYNEKYKKGTLPPQISSTKSLSSLRWKDSESVRHLSVADREARLRKYNMDLIRAKGNDGLPLPIMLTEDEDAQLVNEGVLPPR